MNTSRRQFLKTSGLVAGGMALLAAGPGAALANGMDATTGINLSLLQNAWLKKGLPSPLIYLKEVGLLSLTSNIQDASRKDFLAGRMISVDGLMLSYAESAFLLSASGGFHV